MELFKSITIFVGWLTGSLAGIGTVFYTSGYLASRAHLNLLGMSGIINYGYEYYVQEGAKFFLGVSQIIARISLGLFAVLALIAAAILIILTLLFRDLARLRDFFSRGGQFVLEVYHGNICRLLLYGVVLIALIIHSGSYLEKFGQPLSISNVLYDNSDTTRTDDDSHKIRSWILKGELESIKGHFEYLLWGEITAIILLLAACEICVDFPWRLIWLTPFFLSATIFTLTLPMAYGILLRPMRYPIILVTSKNKQIPDDQKLFLLNKTEKELILWDSIRRKVIWIAADSVERAEVIGVAPLFDARRGNETSN